MGPFDHLEMSWAVATVEAGQRLGVSDHVCGMCGFQIICVFFSGSISSQFPGSRSPIYSILKMLIFLFHDRFQLYVHKWRIAVVSIVLWSRWSRDCFSLRSVGFFCPMHFWKHTPFLMLKRCPFHVASQWCSTIISYHFPSFVA